MGEHLETETVVHRDLLFALAGDVELRLDLYVPAVAQPPVVVYAHGGGWVAGARTEGSGARLRALAAGGVAVASIDYRLAPHARHPDQVTDALAAVAWLRKNGEAYGLSTTRIGAWGASAGAYIATMAGLASQDGDPQYRVDAVVSWFGIGDVAASVARSELEQAILPPPYVEALLGRTSLSPFDDDVVAANPIEAVSVEAPPFLIAHGDLDHAVPETQSRRLHDALVRAGVESTCVIVGGAGHEDGRFDGDPITAMTAAWLRARLS